MKRVVITGIGAITPLGNSVKSYWKGLIEGKSGAATIARFDPSKHKTRFACEVKDFDPLNYVDKGEARKYDTFVHFALAAVQEAITHSGLNLDQIDRTQAGVIWGSGNGGFGTFEEQVTEFAKGDGTPRFNPYFIPKTIPNMASGIISIKHGLKGINFTVVAACSASNAAMMDAFNYIRWGKAKLMITGGSEASITPAAMGGFSAMKAVSTRNEQPEAASRPFDTERDGFVMGEGGAALIFEEYEHALNRGAHIIAEVAGASMTSDAYHLTATHPEGEGAYTAMLLALQDAGLSATDVDYINAHATSTQVGDISELKAIKRLFNADKQPKTSATKSMTGHLLGGAGAIEAIASLLAIQNGWIPPTINVNTLDPIAHGLDIVCNKAIPHEVNVAMSNTFGFGGHNAIMVFKRLNA